MSIHGNTIMHVIPEAMYLTNNSTAWGKGKRGIQRWLSNEMTGYLPFKKCLKQNHNFSEELKWETLSFNIFTSN